MRRSLTNNVRIHSIKLLNSLTGVFLLGSDKVKISDNIELVDIDSLYPYHNNPKEHPAEQIDKIASSIKNYGFVQP